MHTHTERCDKFKFNFIPYIMYAWMRADGHIDKGQDGFSTTDCMHTLDRVRAIRMVARECLTHLNWSHSRTTPANSLLWTSFAIHMQVWLRYRYAQQRRMRPAIVVRTKVTYRFSHEYTYCMIVVPVLLTGFVVHLIIDPLCVHVWTILIGCRLRVQLRFQLRESSFVSAFHYQIYFFKRDFYGWAYR